MVWGFLFLVKTCLMFLLEYKWLHTTSFLRKIAFRKKINLCKRCSKTLKAIVFFGFFTCSIFKDCNYIIHSVTRVQNAEFKMYCIYLGVFNIKKYIMQFLVINTLKNIHFILIIN